jgi:hypothetical protein
MFIVLILFLALWLILAVVGFAIEGVSRRGEAIGPRR